ncbi:VOC family protein [Altericista sp. CCNU0014]|uniref:VOC family protein n=1 Tax=Altericista sp. CCNU0014 TaxID=3082949 RepID=UPI00384E3814
MVVTQFLHAALLVTDLDAAKHFYETVLELPPVERSLSFPGQWYQVGAVQLHLITAEALIGDRVNAQKWGRNRHLALAVTDLDAMKQRLEAHGCDVQMSASGRAALFVCDPDGNLIELAQV